MKPKFAVYWVVSIVMFLVMAVSSARAEIPLTSCLSVAGYLRYEVGLHTAGSNPFLQENHDISLSKFFFQTEWTYQPTDRFKVFANTRVMADATQQWDSDLLDYNAFPIDVPDYDWTMMKASDDEYRAEVWELYADITLGDLWIRAGKQQIAWGEMIGARFLDAVNGVDLSWNLVFEPEEFEILRIPNWMVRAIYSLGPDAIPGFSDISLEGFVNPGDVVPSFIPEYGAPFTLADPLPPFVKVKIKDRRGDTEYGFRVGAMLGDVYFTLNYLHVYADEPGIETKSTSFVPSFTVNVEQRYPLAEIYGLSANYAWVAPNIVFTFEGIWTPNAVYGEAGAAFPKERDQGTFKYALLLNRPTQVLPPTFFHASFLNVMIQWSQTILEGDEDKVVAGPPGDKVDKTTEQIACIVQQPILYNDVTFGIQAAYDFDGGYFMKPSIKYVYGDHWYFDVFTTFAGGSDKRFMKFGYLDWVDSVYGRITFQF
jgi:hypothetical protein